MQRPYLDLNKMETRLSKRKIQVSERTNMVWIDESERKDTRRIRKEGQLDNLGTDKIVKATISNEFLEKSSSQIEGVVREIRQIEK